MEFKYREKNESYNTLIYIIYFLLGCFLICMFLDNWVNQYQRLVLILNMLFIVLGIFGCAHYLKLFSIRIKRNVLHIHNYCRFSHYHMRLRPADIIEYRLQPYEGNEIVKHRFGIDLDNGESILLISTKKIPNKMKRTIFTSEKFIYSIYLYTKNGEELKLKIDEWKNNAE